MNGPVGLPGRPSPIRVLVADDQELVRAGFCVILEAAEGISVVGEASNGADAVAAVAAQRPDVVLMDIRMPGMDGLEATRLITGGGPEAGPKVVMLTTFDLDDYVYEALRSGASGFLLKDAPRSDLIAAVRAAAAGNGLLAPSVTRLLIEAFARRPAAAVTAPSRLASLTAREKDILLLVARGRSNAEIARRSVRRRGDGQDPHRSPAGQAGAAGPGAGGDPGLRDRAGGSRRPARLTPGPGRGRAAGQARLSRQFCPTRSWPKL